MSVRCTPLPRPNWFERRRIRAIYHANFAPTLRKPFGYMMHHVHAGNFALLVARDTAARNRIVSFALAAPLDDTRALYLGYLATDPAQHSRGIGGQLFEALLAYAATLPQIDALIWEVEPAIPNDPTHNNNRRIAFYARHGAQIVQAVAQHYRVPDDTTNGTQPQTLMWQSIGERSTELTHDEIAGWVRAIFNEIYDNADALGAQIIAEMDG